VPDDAPGKPRGGPYVVYVAVGIAAILRIPALLATLRDTTATRMDTGVRGDHVTYR